MSDPEPSPAEQQVRRLLADARHDEELPADVAERLERVLADLHDQAPAHPAPADLAARRRRTARNLLVAAAAVVVLGVGVSQVGTGGQGDADSSDSAGESESRAEISDEDSESGTRYNQQAIPDSAASIPPLVLHAATFEREVRRLEADPGLSAFAAVPQASALDQGTAPLAVQRAYKECDDTAWGAGERILARYDGRRGVLVLRAPVDGTREVDLYLCGETAITRSTSVPVG